MAADDQPARTVQPWVEAADALGPHDRRVLFRWLVAQEYDAFDPKPCQQWTKKLIREHTLAVMDFLAIGLPNTGKPNHVEDAAAYDVALTLAAKQSIERRRSLLAHIGRAAPLAQGIPAPGGPTSDMHLAALLLCLCDAVEQSAHSARGWVQDGPHGEPRGARKARGRG